MKHIHPFILTIGIVLSLFAPSKFFAQSQAENFYQKASDLYDQKEYASAIVFYELVLQNNPKHPKAILHLGLSNYNLSRFNAAIKAFDQLLLLRDHDLTALEHRANAYIAIDEYQTAIKDYNKIIDIAPGSISYVNRANANLLLENFDAALIDFNQALKYDARDSEALAGKADIYYEKGQYEKAIDFYTQSITIYQFDASVYNNRANTFQMLDLMEEALGDYNKAIELEESSASLTNRGKYYLQTESYDQAALDCIEASLLDFNNPDAYHCAGLARLSQGNLQDALENFEKAVDIASDWATAISDLGLVKFKLGDYPGAYYDQRRALELDEHNPTILERLQDCQNIIEQNGLYPQTMATMEEDEALESEILSSDPPKSKDDLVPREYNQRSLRIATILTPQFAKKSAPIQREVLTAKGAVTSYAVPQEKMTRAILFENAIKDNKSKSYHLAIANFNRLIMKDISDYEAYNGRGIALYGLGEIEAAKEDFSRALSINPNFMEAFYNRGRAQYKQGKIAAAIDDFSKVIQHQAHFASAYQWRAKCYSQLNYASAAAVDYQRCMQISPNTCKPN